MIIECINCFKKFDVDQSLIPDSGREIICGSCNHTWFYKKKIAITETKIDEFIISEKANTSKNSDKKNEVNNENNLKSKNIKKIEKNIKLPTKKSRKSSFTLGNIISIILVIIISFIGLIIFLDTFKSPLIDLFPSLELLLFNLFETLKDIFLFIKNLIL